MSAAQAIALSSLSATSLRKLTGDSGPTSPAGSDRHAGKAGGARGSQDGAAGQSSQDFSALLMLVDTAADDPVPDQQRQRQQQQQQQQDDLPAAWPSAGAAQRPTNGKEQLHEQPAVRGTAPPAGDDDMDVEAAVAALGAIRHATPAPGDSDSRQGTPPAGAAGDEGAAAVHPRTRRASAGNPHALQGDAPSFPNLKPRGQGRWQVFLCAQGLKYLYGELSWGVRLWWPWCMGRLRRCLSRAAAGGALCR
jgi:hypothetical protein